MQHICSQSDCPYLGQPSPANSCRCHKTREQMLSERLSDCEETLKFAKTELAALLADPRSEEPEWPVLTEADHRCLTSAYRAICNTVAA